MALPKVNNVNNFVCDDGWYVSMPSPFISYIDNDNEWECAPVLEAFDKKDYPNIIKVFEDWMDDKGDEVDSVINSRNKRSTIIYNNIIRNKSEYIVISDNKPISIKFMLKGDGKDVLIDRLQLSMTSIGFPCNVNIIISEDNRNLPGDEMFSMNIDIHNYTFGFYDLVDVYLNKLELKPNVNYWLTILPDKSTEAYIWNSFNSNVYAIQENNIWNVKSGNIGGIKLFTSYSYINKRSLNSHDRASKSDWVYNTGGTERNEFDCPHNCNSPWGCHCQSNYTQTYFFHPLLWSNGQPATNVWIGAFSPSTNVLVGSKYYAATTASDVFTNGKMDYLENTQGVDPYLGTEDYLVPGEIPYFKASYQGVEFDIGIDNVLQGEMEFDPLSMTVLEASILGNIPKSKIKRLPQFQ